MTNFDDMTLAVEALSGGKNTALLDDMGYPSIVVCIPRFNISDVITGGSDTLHPMFIVNGQQKTKMFISKYQNIVVNDRAYSLPFKMSQDTITFDNAKTYSENKGSGWHLMTNAEWAGIALWCKKNGFMPRGNNNYGCDYSATHEKGVGLSVPCDEVATGSGPISWAHDNSNSGIFDLNGNKNEWVGGLRLYNGEIQVIPDNNAAQAIDQSATSTLWKAILPNGNLVAPGTAGTLKFDYTSAPSGSTSNFNISNTLAYQQANDDADGHKTFETLTAKSGVTIPEILKALAIFPLDSSHGGDGLFMRNNGERLPQRGGYYGGGSESGVFDLFLYNSRTYTEDTLGFRAAK